MSRCSENSDRLLANLNRKDPHFQLDDLKVEDLKPENYVDPYYYIRRPIEPERLKQIYQQAFIYDLLYNFAKEYLPSELNVSKERATASNDDELGQNKSTDTTIDSIKEKVLAYLFKSDVKLNTDNDDDDDEKKTKQSIDHNDSGETALWNTDDLNILRKEFAKIKECNFRLRGKMVAVEEENKQLKDKYERLAIETKSLPGDVKTLEQANERLYIRIQDLESRYTIYAKEIENMDAQMRQTEEEAKRARELNEVLKSEKKALEYQLSKNEMRLKSCENDFLLYYNEKLDAVKFKYGKELAKCKEALTSMSEKYKQERSKYERAQKALEHLRVHFMTNGTQQSAEQQIIIDESKIKFL